MAYYGLSNPWVAKYAVTDQGVESYTGAIKVGEAISTEITPNYNEASLYGDNKQVENVKEFSNADVTLGVTRVPNSVAAMMFGHTIDEEGMETSNGNDAAPYVGYGFIVKSIVGGAMTYRACFLPKVQMVEGTESFETKGDSVTFQTPSLSGKAMANYTGVWRIKSKEFDTEAAADAWIQEQLS